MTDAELIGLAAIVHAETLGMVAENEYRVAVHGERATPAYVGTDFWNNPATERLREELQSRAVL